MGVGVRRQLAVRPNPMTVSSDFTLPETTLSVGGVTDYIEALLENPQLQNIWVVGEVSSCKPHFSGLFFTLRDLDSDATIGGVIWKSIVPRLTTRPEVGETVAVLGSVRLYRKRGDYQLYGVQVLPVGAGMQALQYQKLRQRLASEGLFDAARKRSLPEHPRTIAVVTSPQAAAWGDIQRTLRSRYPGLRVLLSPTLVQGDRAPQSIVNAIARVQQDGRAQLLILARGGGSVEDLAAFDDERVVRAVVACDIPVVTGIGHERDESLADLAADVYAHTPTAAAERVVPELAELQAAHQRRSQRLQEAMLTRLSDARSHLDRLAQRLSWVPVRRQLQREQDTLQRLKARLLRGTSQRLQQAQQRQRALGERLNAIDPQAVLDRGYAVVRSSGGEIVRSAADVKTGRVLSVKLASGWVKVKVTAVGDDDNVPFVKHY